MIGILVVTHAGLGSSLIETAEFIFGKQLDNIASVSINIQEDPERLRKKIKSGISKVRTDTGVIILTDMFGGTPSNLAISIMDQGDIEIVAGVNLPMLIKIATARETQPLRELTVMAKESGQKYIHIASEVLNSKES